MGLTKRRKNEGQVVPSSNLLSLSCTVQYVHAKTSVRCLALRPACPFLRSGSSISLSKQVFHLSKYIISGIGEMMLSRLTRPSRTICWWQGRRLFSGDKTYYDSQSGMHVALHDENEISLYLHLPRHGWRSASSDGARIELESLEEARKGGFVGVRLQLHIDEQGLLTELSPSEPGLTFFCGSPGTQNVAYPDNINLLFEYTDSKQTIHRHVSSHVARGTKTSIGLFDPCYYARDPALVANGVASLMDETGGGDFIWLEPDETVDEDELIRMCEELSYLDVSGPTIKSRLVVAAQTEYQVEECLNMGVNKFVLEDPFKVNWLRSIVEDQGKHLVQD